MTVYAKLCVGLKIQLIDDELATIEFLYGSQNCQVSFNGMQKNPHFFHNKYFVLYRCGFSTVNNSQLGNVILGSFMLIGMKW